MRFGIAQVEISPPFRTKMAGYGGRLDYFDDIHDPLMFSCIVIEDRRRRAVIGAADLLWYHDEQIMDLRKRVAAIARAPVDNVLFNASHTHGGPLILDNPGYFAAPVGSAAPYREWLGEQILAAVRKAAATMQTGSLWLGIGKTSVPMNRRPKRNGQVVNAPHPNGPVDDSLQVLALRDKGGALRAVTARVSCHPVSTGARHRLTADYPGAFRAAFTKALGPDVIPVFLQGVGGDARPSRVCDGDKWRVMDHDELSIIGQDLLAETVAVLTSGSMEKLAPLTLRGRFNVADVPCEKNRTTREGFEELLEKGSSSERRYSELALGHLERDGEVPSSVPVRVQTIWLTKDLAVVGILGEVLMGLGKYVEKSLLPKRAIVLGYCNGSGCYLPDSKELARGGYEQTVYLRRGYTGPFKRGIEKVIAEAVWREPS
ncbi:MAG: hypothetical protein GXP25_01505 [Planctomycetes bacterium]|nr:hypothetical protein [Planctomycetota bacterium]